MSLTKKLNSFLLKRVEQADHSTLNSRKIYILPTKEGLIYSFLVILMLFSAINFNSSLVFFFTFLMVGIALTSMFMTQYNLLNLDFSFTSSQAVFSGQHINLPIIIRDIETQTKKKNTHHYSIELQFSSDKENELNIQNNFTDVLSHQSATIELVAKTQHRGLFPIPAMTIATCYPLGLFRAWANIQLKGDAIVYPSPVTSFNYQAHGSEQCDDQGGQGKGFDDFNGFKYYQIGESMAHIHWKAYAKEQGLLSKIFSGGSQHEYWLNWFDLVSEQEQRISQLCRLIIDAEQRGDRYGLVLPNKRINISQGQAHHHQCLKSLALL